MLEDIINELILDYLTDELGYDFVHQVIAIYGVQNWQGTFEATKVEYRGTNGEYGILTLEGVSPEDFYAALGE